MIYAHAHHFCTLGTRFAYVRRDASRLRVVPHFSLGTVERAKRERA